MRRLATLLAVLAALSLPAPAQQDAEDGGGFIERTLEDQLSSPGSAVRITGFAGALSARATMERMTIADADGVWLTLREVVLDWNRAALLRGRVEVTELSAAEIEVARPPLPASGAPAPQARGFSLPDLPVSIEIGRVAAERVTLGAALFGQAAELSLEGAMRLAGGEGEGRIAATRLDGPGGSFRLEAGYANDTGILTVSALIEEPAGGIVARLAGLPDAPALRLDAGGTGPLSDFSADLVLATDGVERLAGTLELLGEAEDRRFRADLSGDIAPLFLPDYQAFFGPEIALRVAGRRTPDGALHLPEFALTARQLRLSGAVTVGPDGLPRVIDLTGDIASEDGGPVLLPIAGAPTRIDRADLRIAFDHRDGEDWIGQITAQALERPGLRARRLGLTGRGRIVPGAAPEVTASLGFAAEALDLGDAAAGAALGERVTGSAVIGWRQGAPVTLDRLAVAGETYGLTGRASFAPAESGVTVTAEVDLAARDLSAFAGVARRPLGGRIDARVTATSEPVAGRFEAELKGTGRDLVTGTPALDALLAGTAELDLAMRRDATGTRLDRLIAETRAATVSASATLTDTAISGAADIDLRDTAALAPGLPAPLTATLRADGPTGALPVQAELRGAGFLARGDAVLDISGNMPGGRGTARIEIADLSPFSAAAGLPLAGGIEADLQGRLSADLADFELTLDAVMRDLGIGMAELDAVFAGRTDLSLAATGAGDRVRVPVFRLDGPALAADGTGTVTLDADRAPTGGEATLSATLKRPDAVVPGLPGPLRAELTAAGAAAAWDITAEIAGPELAASTALALDLSGATPRASGRLTAAADDIAPFSTLAGRDLAGAADLDIRGSAAADLSAFDVTLDAEADDLSVGQADADALLAGHATAHLAATRAGGTTRLSAFRLDTPAVSAETDGQLGGDDGTARFDIRLADIAPHTGGISGPATLAGEAMQGAGGDWQVTAAGTGPGGLRADLDGSAAADFARLDLGLTGSAPLAAANRFIAPRAVSGRAAFDLRVAGPPALDSVRGRATVAGARFVAPTLGISLSDLMAELDLSGRRADIALRAAVDRGGRLNIDGPITLSGAIPAELTVRLDRAVLADPTLYETRATGDITVSGPLAGGARIGGAVRLGRTEIRVPAGGVGGVNPIPDLIHVGEPPAVRATRARAGLIVDPGAPETGGTAFPIDLSVTAPGQIFVRGRGLDAELGGTIRLTGTTARIIPQGRFELIRGRLDILTQRLRLTEGAATLEGDFDPYLDFTAATRSDDTQIFITLRGPASEPEILFRSEPDLPEDEVLARLLFDRDLENLSPLQAARLAAAVATLAGRGGEGIVGRLRQSFGLDDLNVESDGTGGAAVSAGKYISENVYTDVTVDSEGKASVAINLDLSSSFTVRGEVDSTGESGLGLFWERDY